MGFKIMKNDERCKNIGIKYADQIVKEINKRGPITIPKGCVTGEEFEKWLYEESNKNFINKN